MGGGGGGQRSRDDSQASVLGIWKNQIYAWTEEFTGNVVFPGSLSAGSMLVTLNRFQCDR